VTVAPRKTDSAGNHGGADTKDRISAETPSPEGASGENKYMTVGGQAVIEGVMMRSPHAIATAVRLPNGAIELNTRPFTSFIHRHRLLNIPIVRGAISFFEMLVIGIETLNWSADMQMKYEDTQNGKETGESHPVRNGIMLWGSMALALAVGLGIFFAVPIFIATLLGLSKGALLFNLVAGVVRLTLFILYIYLISRMPDIRRVFRYHGAEHMSIFALEASSDLSIESARKESRFHPRCGTSFILIVAIASIVLFGFADSLFPTIFGHMQSVPERLATHLLLLPFVAGFSYELLKLSGRFRANRLVQILIAPGLWLQTMTTGDPDDEMLEVALCALKAAIAKEELR
jgi:uncharacterized protein YqhQ